MKDETIIYENLNFRDGEVLEIDIKGSGYKHFIFKNCKNVEIKTRYLFHPKITYTFHNCERFYFMGDNSNYFHWIYADFVRINNKNISVVGVLRGSFFLYGGYNDFLLKMINSQFSIPNSTLIRVIGRDSVLSCHRENLKILTHKDKGNFFLKTY